MQNAGCVGVGLLGGLAAEGEQLRDVVSVLPAQLHALGVGLQVVVAIWQAESAGADLNNHRGGIHGVLIRPRAKEEIAGSIVMQRGDGSEQLWPRLECIDPRKLWLDWLVTVGIDGGLVHAGLKVVADLLLDRCAVGSLGVLLQDAPEKLLILIRKLRVDVPCGLVGGNRVQLLPSTAGVLIEVHARVDAAIHAGEIKRRRVRHLRERLWCGLLRETGRGGKKRRR